MMIQVTFLVVCLALLAYVIYLELKFWGKY